jgi:uncharacterized membrane protein HdeD (DUF308 family)
MTLTAPTAADSTTTPTTSGLRTLYVIRAIFSIIWVALVFATSTKLTTVDKLTAIAAVLLIIYPLWDAVATFAARRISGAGGSNRISVINIVLGVAATVAMIIAAFDTIGSALLVFGIWAFLSGAIQLTLAIRRLRTVGAQWPMIISGGLSVFAGLSFVAMSFSATSTLSSVAGYSAFGAFWFIVSVIALTVRGRRSAR